jgi:hypothetical protein
MSTEEEAENIFNAFTNSFGSYEIRKGLLYVIIPISDDYDLNNASDLVPAIRFAGFGDRYDINVSTNFWYDPFCLRVPHVLFSIPVDYQMNRISMTVLKSITTILKSVSHP